MSLHFTTQLPRSEALLFLDLHRQLLFSSGPQPIRMYEGADLLRIAKQKHGGEEGLLKKLRRQGRLWKVDPVSPPQTRYFVLHSDRSNLTRSQETGYWRAPVRHMANSYTRP
jgi:hypothetical protein